MLILNHVINKFGVDELFVDIEKFINLEFVVVVDSKETIGKFLTILWMFGIKILYQVILFSITESKLECKNLTHHIVQVSTNQNHDKDSCKDE